MSAAASVKEIASELPSSKAADWSGRIGFVAKGIVYGIVGILATQAAIGSGGAAAGSTTAIRTIANQQFGTVLLVMVAIGLVCYIVWRFVQAIGDVDRKGNSAKGLLMRSGYACSGLAHIFLAWTALSMAFGWGVKGEGQHEREWTAWLMSFPLGQWLVGLVGAIVIGIGIGQFVLAYMAWFMNFYKQHKMTPLQRRGSRFAGRFGLSARGVVFCLIGVFFIQAAIRADANEAAGLSGAFQALAQQAYGPWLLGLVAIGFVAYGLFCFTIARYRYFTT